MSLFCIKLITKLSFVHLTRNTYAVVKTIEKPCVKDKKMKTKAPFWFWIIAVLAVLWNFGGVFDFVMTHSQNADYFAEFTVEQRDYFYAYPIWASAIWAIAVFGALLASVLLLFKSRYAVQLFAVSIFAMFASFAYQLISNPPDEFYTAPNLFFTAIIWVLSFLLLFFAARMRSKGILK